MEALKYFFTYDTGKIPHQLIDYSAGTRELFWLVFAYAYAAVIILLFCFIKKQARDKMILIFATFSPFLEIIRYIIIASQGYWDWSQYLPLHMCSVTSYIICLAGFTKRKLPMEWVYALGLAGATVTIMFPEGTVYPLFHFQTLQGLMVHANFYIITAFMIIGGYFRPSVKNLPKVFGMLVFLAIADYIINPLLHSNYMYVTNPDPGTPLMDFASWTAWMGFKQSYLLVELGILAVVWVVLYTPWVVYDAVKRNRKTTAMPGDNSKIVEGV